MLVKFDQAWRTAKIGTVRDIPGGVAVYLMRRKIVHFVKENAEDDVPDETTPDKVTADVSPQATHRNQKPKRSKRHRR